MAYITHDLKKFANDTFAADLAPCTEAEFLAEYLLRAPEGLIVG